MIKTVTTKKLGSQTAGGRDIHISEDALIAAQKILDGDRDSSVGIARESSHALDPVHVEQSRVPSFPGFQTAGGSRISISESALEKAQQLLACDGEDSLVGKQLGHNQVRSSGTLAKVIPRKVGFQTARGNAVKISEASLRRAKQFLAADEAVLTDLDDSVETNSDHAATSVPSLQCTRPPHSSDIDTLNKGVDLVPDNVSSSKMVPSVVGFQTAGGNLIKISEASIAKAKQLLDSATDPEECSNAETINVAVPRRVGFQTARGGSINISEASLKKARQLLTDEEDPPHDLGPEHDFPRTVQSSNKVSPRKIGFQTARGNAISVSEVSLKKAKQLLADEGNHSKDFTAEHTDCPTSVKASLGKVGFHTAKGNAIHISEASLQKAKQLLASDTEDDQRQTNESFKGQTRKESPSIGFQTAGGNAINVSEASLQKAKQLLAADALDAQRETNESFKGLATEAPPPVVGFQTGRGARIHISESSLKKAKQLLSDENDSDRALSFQVPTTSCQEHMPSTSGGLIGFQTGAGRKIEISESSLKKARQLLADPLEESTVGQPSNYSNEAKDSQPQGYGQSHNSSTTQMKLSTNASQVPTFDQSRVGTGFQTGGGKSVQISKSSLQKARKLLADDADTSGEEMPTSGTSNCQKNIDQRDVSKSSKQVVGFKTGGGRAVSVSEESLKHARNLIASDTVPNDAMVKAEETFLSTNVGQVKNPSALQRNMEQPNRQTVMKRMSGPRADQTVPVIGTLQNKNPESRLPTRTLSSGSELGRQQMEPQRRFGRTTQGTGQKLYKREYFRYYK